MVDSRRSAARGRGAPQPRRRGAGRHARHRRHLLAPQARCEPQAPTDAAARQLLRKQGEQGRPRLRSSSATSTCRLGWSPWPFPRLRHLPRPPTAARPGRRRRRGPGVAAGRMTNAVAALAAIGACSCVRQALPRCAVRAGGCAACSRGPRGWGRRRRQGREAARGPRRPPVGVTSASTSGHLLFIAPFLLLTGASVAGSLKATSDGVATRRGCPHGRRARERRGRPRAPRRAPASRSSRPRTTRSSASSITATVGLGEPVQMPAGVGAPARHVDSRSRPRARRRRCMTSSPSACRTRLPTPAALRARPAAEEDASEPSRRG
jgi:hypothetical protein